jgi:hypothetical protein
MELNDAEKGTLLFIVKKMKELNINSINIGEGEILFGNNNVYSINKLYSTESDNSDQFSSTSVAPVLSSEIKNPNFLSETSEIVPGLSETSEEPRKQTGGYGSIFKSSKYSDTSSAKFTDVGNLSQTSSVNFNGRSDKYSDTSVLAQNGGNGFETSDTLRSVSELKERKNLSKSNLDMGIFKKMQSGGSSNLEIKKRMMEVGINSSSTSSVCE